MLNSKKLVILVGMLVLLLGVVGAAWGLLEDDCRDCHGNSLADTHHGTACLLEFGSCTPCHPVLVDPPGTLKVLNCVYSGCHDGNDDDVGPGDCDGSEFRDDCKPEPAWCNIINPDGEILPKPPKVLPGGILEVGAIVGSNHTTSGTVLFGTKVTKPDETKTGWLIGPVEVYLTPGQTKSDTLSHTIPTDWESGIYIYHGYVGKYGIIYDESQFEFEVK
jgi:hypothetical protein